MVNFSKEDVNNTSGKKILEEWIVENNLYTLPFHKITKKLRTDIKLMHEPHLHKLLQENFITPSGSLTQHTYSTIVSLKNFLD